jgi:hypothetical protein
MKKRVLNRRFLMMLSGVVPYLLGMVLMPFDVWVDPLTLFPLLLAVAGVNFYTAKSAGQFMLLQGGQLLGLLGYGWLCGRSYSLYLTGNWSASDAMSFGTTVMVVLTVLLSGVLSVIKATGKRNGTRIAVTTTLLSLSGITLLPTVLIALLWLLFSML